MKLHAVEAALLVGHGGVRRIVRAGHRAKARRQRFHTIAVAHPHVEQRAAVVLAIEDAFEQPAGAPTCTSA
jgi:hypothetical protein